MSEPDPTSPPAAETPAAKPPPSTAVSRYDGPRNVTELRAYAELLAGSDNPRYQSQVLPRQFRGNPSAVAFAVEYARALNMPPVTAITGMHVIDGKPSATAGLISALIRNAGHKLRIWTEGTFEGGDLAAYCTIVRHDDPGHTYKTVWTLPRAVRADLLKLTDDGRYVAFKPNSGWDKYQEAMLKARALTECARDAAEDALFGMHYTPEELGASVDQNGEVVYTVTQVQNWGSGDKPTEPEKPAEPEPVSDAYIDELRAAILDASSVADLKVIWEQVVKSGLFTDETWASTPMADRDAVASTCKAVFNGEVARLKAAENPDDGQGAETPPGPQGGPQGDNLGLPYEVVRLPNGEIDHVATLRNEVAWKKARRDELAEKAVANPTPESIKAADDAATEATVAGTPPGVVDQFVTALAELTPQEVKAVSSAARAWGRKLTHDNPEHNERDARVLLEAVDRLLAWRPYDPTNYGNPAVDRRINPDGEMEVPPAMPTAVQAASMGLDAVPVDEIRHDQQTEHEATLAAQRHADTVEDRSEQARQFDPPPLGKDAAKVAARQAARDAELKTQPPANPVN
jgi:hypothetical protein